MRKFAMSIFLATFMIMVLFTPLNDASSNGKPNSAVGCSCHGSSSTSSVTPTHNFPSTYTPGQTYTVTIGVTGGVSGTNGGFSLEVTGGTLSNPGGFAQISQGSATHSGSQARSWTVDWTAPSAGSGQVTARLAVNTVNNNGMTSGDAWNTLTHNIQEDVPVNQPPAVSNVQIQPSGDVGYNQDLQLSYTYQDPESDPESNSDIKWFVDGNHVPSMNGKTTIMSSDTTIGEVWTASVIPRDSNGNLGNEVQSANSATIVDLDSDSDGVYDSNDAFPNDPSEQYDADNDGVGDNADAFPNNATEQFDSDNDGVGDNADTDDDNDGLLDTEEATLGTDPLDEDSDDDEVNDKDDAYPLDATETTDSDNDGTGDNADTDDDNDGLLDAEEATLGTDPLDADTDGDEVNDKDDALPLDANETIDSDGDGVGDNSDTDDDNDGLLDTEEATLGTDPFDEDSDDDEVNDKDDAFPLDASETSDSDGDGVGDNTDVFPNDSLETVDSDNDGVGDNADAFPNDPTETMDSDGDGVGDIAQKIAEDKAAAEAEEEAQQRMFMIIGIVVVIAIVAAIVLVRRKGSSEIELSEGKPQLADEMFNEYAPIEPVVPQTSPVAEVMSMPVAASPEPVAEPTVVQQWTDESGYTWRKMSDDSTMWWTGSDWQKV